MERIDLVVKKEGDQFCLYTKDGSKKIACHPTAKEAYAQEAAIAHSQAAAEKLVAAELVGAERAAAITAAAVTISEAVIKAGRESDRIQFRLGDIDISAGTFETLGNGDVVKWIPLAEQGEKWINGGREFDITSKEIDQGLKNFDASGKAPLPVTFGHLDDSGAPARAWIEDVQLRADKRPWGKVRFLKDTWDAIQKGEYKFFSLEFYPNDVNQKGEEIGFRFDGGAILNKPFFPIRVDQGRPSACFALSRFHKTDPPPTPTPAPAAARGDSRGKGVSMDPNADPNATPAPKIEGDKVTLSRGQYQELVKVRDENASLRGELETARGTNAANEKRITQLERSTGAGRIRSAIKTLQRDHRVVVQLGDFAIESSDAECFEWLATAPMGVTTIEGLEKLARDQEATAHLPRIPGGKEVGSGSDRPEPVDLTTEAGRAEAVRRRAAQLKRDFKKDELELVLARRHQSLEAFAVEELASEHPAYRKELLALAKK